MDGKDGPEINTKIDPKNYNKDVGTKRDLNQIIVGLFDSSGPKIV